LIELSSGNIQVCNLRRADPLENTTNTGSSGDFNSTTYICFENTTYTGSGDESLIALLTAVLVATLIALLIAVLVATLIVLLTAVLVATLIALLTVVR